MMLQFIMPRPGQDSKSPRAKLPLKAISPLCLRPQWGTN